jgi:hypothetical protein
LPYYSEFQQVSSRKKEKLKMTRARLDGLYILLVGTVIFLVAGFALEMRSSGALQDFRVLYYPARCLILHDDPYKASEIQRISHAEGGDRPSDTATVREIVTRYIYPPTAFTFTVPFAMLPWGPAHLLWMIVTAGSLILAAFLIWNLGANHAPILSGVLAGCVLANSELIACSGNAAGIVVSLCIVAVWCFMRERYVPAGILCLAISLAFKPHDSCLVWLFFFLAGGAYRRNALRTFFVFVALSLPAVLWIWNVSPHWMQEMNGNIATFSAHGGLLDPGPASTAAHGPSMMTNLQAVISVFRDDSRIYNPASYLACAPLLLVWAFVTLRSRFSLARAWLALAAVVPLTMLVTYHRSYDAKLLLLTVPACAMLWAEGGVIGWIALVVNTAGIVLTGDIPWAMLLILAKNLHISPVGLSGKIMTVVLVQPAPLILLAMSIFYLWVYMRRDSNKTGVGEDGEPEGAALAPTAA